MKTKTLVLLSLLFLFRGACPAEAKNSLYINEILVENASSSLDPYFKEFSGWIEVYNAGPLFVNLSGFYLVEGLKKQFQWEIPPDTFVLPNGFTVFWADGKNAYNHTNFKLKIPNGLICLFTPKGELVDEMFYRHQITDVSFGRKPDGSGNLFYFDKPTPNAPNNAPGYETENRTNPPKFSLAGGFYQGNQFLKLSVPFTSAVIRYTVDGSIPTELSALYSAPIYLNSTTVIRARAFNPRRLLLSSATATHTYFINERFSLPVVSLATDPANLWDSKIGIYVKGENASPVWPYWGSNFLEKWERPVSVEFFEPNGVLRFALDAGAKPAGSTSLANPVKSLAVRARKKYGKDEIDYQIFNNRPALKYKSFLLRNSGDDWAATLIRDVAVRRTVQGQMDLDFQVHRPAILFINGAYWGVHYLSEKIDRFFLASNHDGVDYHKINLIAYRPDPTKFITQRIMDGNGDDYSRLIYFINSHSMSVPENYRYVKTQMDINEYINYYIVELYIANEDWPGGNVKYWHPGTNDGKWRWILYDTNLALGNYGGYADDLIKVAMQPNGHDWPNPPSATFLFRKLMENSEFKNELIQRFASYLNTTFQPDRVVKIIENAQAEIEPEMPRYIAKWKNQLGDFNNLRFPATLSQWKSNIVEVTTFARQRPAYVRQHIMDNFHLSGTVALTLQVDKPNRGYVIINGVPVPSVNFKGVYFKDIPVQLSAVPKFGYKFRGWQGGANERSESISIILTKDTTLKAIFAPALWF